MPGKHHIEVDVKYNGPALGEGGMARFPVDGRPDGEGKLAHTLAFRMSLDETLDCGEKPARRSARTIRFASN